MSERQCQILEGILRDGPLNLVADLTEQQRSSWRSWLKPSCRAASVSSSWEGGSVHG